MKNNKWLNIILVFLVSTFAFGQPDMMTNGIDSSGNARRALVDSAGRFVLASDTCTTILESVLSVGTSAVATPATALANRKFVFICNSPENTGTPFVKCRGDGATPVIGIAGVGQALSKGDCITISTTSGVVCVADTAATGVSITECQ